MMSYIALAVGYMLSGERENAPSRFWLGLTFALVLSCSFLWPWADPLESHLSPLSLLPLLLSITFLAATAFVLSQLRGERCERFNRVRGITLPLSLMVGGGLVLASLFLTVTLKDGTGTGWSVVTRQTQWVTYYASMGQGAFFGPTIDWLQPVFAPVGYVLYLLGTAGMLAMILLLVKSRFTVEKMQASGLFKWLSTLIIFVSLWLFTDVFWGWHFVDLPYVPWAAAVALGCWLLMLAFGAILLAEMAHGEAASWRFRALLVFQVPLAGFNVLMLPDYYQRHAETYLPGLGLLIAGMQVASWACMLTLVGGERRREENPTNI